ncbi:MAG: N-acetylmuramoyl-L-alanine amidase [Chromatiales bacterium]|nr:N-acetylmuramoyl-L-alanine amidase [Chromatiales bacterium]
MKRLFLSATLLLWTVPSLAGPAVEGARLWSAPDHTRVVLDLSESPEHNLFSLDNPPRIVVDIDDARLRAPLPKVDKNDQRLRRVRFGTQGKTDLRMVLDLKRGVRPRSFVLKPTENYGYRLVVDLEDPASKGKPLATLRSVAKTEAGPRNVVIAIDAGHGGEDPGARGPRGVLEKDVALKIARQLYALVEKEPGMKPVLIRTGDYYIGLRQRIEKAREAQADFFVSIHANAFSDSAVGGAAVYTLSPKGATTTAAHWLAERENAADLVGGVTLEDKGDDLARTLLDLSMTATVESSGDAGRYLLKSLGRLGKLHKRSVQRANFVVLKSPDIPSVLVETAFITNPWEERRLNDTKHQQRLADAMLRGVRDYFRRNAPPDTLFAHKNHVIAWGDTLSEIAQKYNISLDKLRNANGITGDRLRVGQVLRIPAEI